MTRPKPGEQQERHRAEIDQDRQQRGLDALDQRARQSGSALPGGSAG